MLGQLNLAGLDRVEQAIERLKTFEPPEGYYLAFSGGKDSVTVKALMDMAGVKYDAHYNVTSVDPPELVKFVKTFKDVEFKYPTDKDGRVVTMWRLIPQNKIPPTRIARYCCKYLKEGGGAGRFVVTGVRQAESSKRKHRAGLEVSDTNTGKRDRLDPDNPNQGMIHICQMKAQRILNPIIDWTTEDVWEFIKGNHIPYCELYDRGYKRLGCIGCPMTVNREKELNDFPKYKEAYLRAFDRMLKVRREKGLKTTWKNAQEVYDWWLQQ